MRDMSGRKMLNITLLLVSLVPLFFIVKEFQFFIPLYFPLILLAGYMCDMREGLNSDCGSETFTLFNTGDAKADFLMSNHVSSIVFVLIIFAIYCRWIIKGDDAGDAATTKGLLFFIAAEVIFVLFAINILGGF